MIIRVTDEAMPFVAGILGASGVLWWARRHELQALCTQIFVCIFDGHGPWLSGPGEEHRYRLKGDELSFETRRSKVVCTLPGPPDPRTR